MFNFYIKKTAKKKTEMALKNNSINASLTEQLIFLKKNLSKPK